MLLRPTNGDSVNSSIGVSISVLLYPKFGDVTIAIAEMGTKAIFAIVIATSQYELSCNTMNLF